MRLFASWTVFILSLALSWSLGDRSATGLSRNDLWTDRPLDVLRADSPPNTALWDSWIAFTDDLAHVAYGARFRSGDRMRESVVFDGRRGPEFGYASRPAVSPDGCHLAFIAVTEGIDPLPAYLVVGDARVQIQIRGRELGPTWIPVFSPDSSKLAFRAERPGGKYAIGVLDVDAVEREPGAADRSVTWGPEFMDMDRPGWAPDSSAVAYAAARSRSDWVVMVGNEIRATYKDATGVAYAPSGVLTYQAADDSGHFVMIGNERQARFDAVTDPTFRPDGTVIYGATERGQAYVIVGTERRPVPKPVEGAAVSGDGTRMTWWYREDGRRRIVIDGTAGPKFTRVSRPVIHGESGRFVYTAQRDDGSYVVTPLGVSPRYQGVLWNPRISPDGTKAGFVAYVDNRLWWKVLPLQ